MTQPVWLQLATWVFLTHLLQQGRNDCGCRFSLDGRRGSGSQWAGRPHSGGNKFYSVFAWKLLWSAHISAELSVKRIVLQMNDKNNSKKIEQLVMLLKIDTICDLSTGPTDSRRSQWCSGFQACLQKASCTVLLTGRSTSCLIQARKEKLRARMASSAAAAKPCRWTASPYS